MWIPGAEADIEQAIASGTLVETLTFDAKALPGKTKDIAKDIAAMAVDGGVIVYGVAEDENKRPTRLAPFPLAGAAERIDQIARSSISEPITCQIHTLPSKDDPSSGYLVVVVPVSPRAPHMVTVDKELRYYGRSATGNTILGEGEVARLYERRERWEVDRATLLENEVKNSPLPPRQNAAYLYLVAKPVVHDEDFIERIQTDTTVQERLTSFINSASDAAIFPHSYDPDFRVMYHWDRDINGYAIGMGQNIRDGNRRAPREVLDLSVDVDGTVHLFCGGAGLLWDSKFLIREMLIAGLTTRFTKFTADLYAAARNYGAVDIALALTGLENGISSHLNGGTFPQAVAVGRENEYRRHGRFLMSDLSSSPHNVAAELTMRFIRAATRDSYNPFAQGAEH